jgi:hypothetical protein
LGVDLCAGPSVESELASCLPADRDPWRSHVPKRLTRPERLALVYAVLGGVVSGAAGAFIAWLLGHLSFLEGLAAGAVRSSDAAASVHRVRVRNDDEEDGECDEHGNEEQCAAGASGELPWGRDLGGSAFGVLWQIVHRHDVTLDPG